MKKVILLLCLASVFSSCRTQRINALLNENAALQTEVKNLANKLNEGEKECKNTTLQKINDCYNACNYLVDNNISYDEFKKRMLGSESSCCNNNGNPIASVNIQDILRLVAKYRNERFNVINNEAAQLQNRYSFFTNYANERIGRIVNNDIFTDSRAITFSTDTIQNFICKIKKTMIEKNINSNFAFEGLRFYYIVYDKQIPYCNQIPDIYNNVHSVLILPIVRDIKNNTTREFDPRYVQTYRPAKDSSTEPMKITVDFIKRNLPFNCLLRAIESDNSVEMLMQNKGSLCPPPHGGCEGYDIMKLADCIYINQINVEDYDDVELNNLFNSNEFRKCLTQQ